MLQPKNYQLILCMIIFAMIACSKRTAYSPEIENALKAAGNNRTELEQVLTHYETAGDSLKLEAASYLIANMEGHGYASYALYDSSGREIEFEALDYADFKALLQAADSLETLYGDLDFDKKEIIDDLDTITSDFLIQHIDYAFLAWEEKPWAQNLSFEQFKEYVLPYRGSNEPLESWRKCFLDKYADLENAMNNPADPIEAAVLINDDIKSWFKFDERCYFHPTDQGLAEMLENKLGRCEDMTNITIYAMRANGLAVTSDYTPCWANAGNNHAWNAIVAPDGRVTPFMGAESNPGSYKLSYKLAKVFRKTFGLQKNNLAFQPKKQEKVPGWLGGKSYLDVTADYVDVCDVELAFDNKPPDSVDIAYLCVFNSGEWRAVQWGRIDNYKAVFAGMGTGIAYLPALYINEKIEPFDDPFILYDDCHIDKLSPDSLEIATENGVDFQFNSLLRFEGGLRHEKIKSEQEYELFFWDHGWQSVGKITAEKDNLEFQNIPAGCLYWLVEVDSDSEERIFTLENSAPVWW